MPNPSPDQVTPPKLFEMMAGFKYTAVLRTAIELRVFDAMADGPRDAGEIASRLGTDERATGMLLGSLAAIGVLGRTAEGGYELLPGVAELLVTTSPRYCGGIASVASSNGEWAALGQLTETVRTGGPADCGPVAEADGFEYWVDFATHTTFGTQRAAQMLAEVMEPWAAGRETLDVLDVGAGHGLLGFGMAQANEQARVWTQDWANVLDVAEQHAKRLGVRDRVELLPGDAFTCPLGGPYDLVVVGNVLFHFSEERSEQLLRRLAALVKPGGRLVVLGFTTGDQPPAVEPHGHLLGLLMLSWTDGGRMHSTGTYRRMLEGAGLTGTEVHNRPPLPLQMVVATKP
jgi:O-methyltransferase domain/Dimerisation domain